jgi:hypothetical protein
MTALPVAGQTIKPRPAPPRPEFSAPQPSRINNGAPLTVIEELAYNSICSVSRSGGLVPALPFRGSSLTK